MTGPSTSSAVIASSAVESADADQARRRGVLKKDSSYDDTLRPILKNNAGPQSADYRSDTADTISVLPSSTLNDSAGALSSTSSEDLENFIDANNRGFVGKNFMSFPLFICFFIFANSCKYILNSNKWV